MSCLQQVLKVLFTFTMVKYAKNINYVLVQPSKDKDGVAKQDWDEYK